MTYVPLLVLYQPYMGSVPSNKLLPASGCRGTAVTLVVGKGAPEEGLVAALSLTWLEPLVAPRPALHMLRKAGYT